jgi:hypothetical protein
LRSWIAWRALELMRKRGFDFREEKLGVYLVVSTEEVL